MKNNLAFSIQYSTLGIGLHVAKSSLPLFLSFALKSLKNKFSERVFIVNLIRSLVSFIYNPINNAHHFASLQSRWAFFHYKGKI